MVLGCLLVGVQCDRGSFWARRFSGVRLDGLLLRVSSRGRGWACTKALLPAALGWAALSTIPTSLGNIGPGSVVDAPTAPRGGQDHSPAPLGNAGPQVAPRENAARELKT